MSNREGISIVCGTDRHRSNSERVARICEDLLREQDTPCELLLLSDVPIPDDRSEQYKEPSGTLKVLVDKHVAAYHRFLFIVPEYNGGFPGILKLFIDLVPPRLFHGKKAGLVGISDGRAGNLRGLDHLTAVLNYLRVDVHWKRPKFSAISSLFNTEGELSEARRNDLVEVMEWLTEQVVAER